MPEHDFVPPPFPRRRRLDVNVASEGDTELEAIANLREALELYFEDAPAEDTPLVEHAHVDSLILKSA